MPARVAWPALSFACAGLAIALAGGRIVKIDIPGGAGRLGRLDVEVLDA